MTPEQEREGLIRSYQFTPEETEALRLDIEDNFSDLTPEDRYQILCYIDARFYYNNKFLRQ